MMCSVMCFPTTEIFLYFFFSLFVRLFVCSVFFLLASSEVDSRKKTVVVFYQLHSTLVFVAVLSIVWPRYRRRFTVPFEDDLAPVVCDAVLVMEVVPAVLYKPYLSQHYIKD